MSNPTPISFEFFPPKTAAGLEKLQQTAESLLQHQPEYFSVTFGAGGSTCDSTFATVKQLQTVCKNITPHLSCISSSKQQLTELLKQYANIGVKHILALRGDRPSGAGLSAGDMQYGAELVSLIREQYGADIHISVAAYPETHPESADMHSEITHFKHKVQAGANSAVTQYFYNSDAYFNFCDLCQTNNIDIPIIPGIMPIYGLERLQRFSAMCGAEIPRWLEKSLKARVNKADDFEKFSIELVSKLCQKLIAGGAPALHFYTLNQAEYCKKVIASL